MKFEPKLYRLSNGIPVILDPMDIETAYVRIGFAYGSRNEKPNEYGLAHFCEHMLFAGTTRFATHKERAEFLDNNGGNIGAGTSRDDIVFYGRIIAENLSVLLDVIADALKNSLFDEDKIEKEKNIVLDELRRDMDSASRIMREFVVKSIFGSYVPNGLRNLGSEETIKSFTRNQIVDFIKNFTTKNCVIAISGKINDIDATLKHLDELFAFLPTNEVEQNRDIKYTPTVAHNLLPDKNNVRLVLLWPGLYRDILENEFNRRCLGKFERYLVQQVWYTLRLEYGFVYGIDMSLYGNENFEVNGFTTQTSVANIVDLVKAIAKICYKIYSQNTITENDLQRFINKNKLINANFLEDSNRRATKLYEYMQWFKVLYNFEEDRKMSESITVQDVIEKTRGYFDGPMSVITQGVAFDADLKQVWIDNFK